MLSVECTLLGQQIVLKVHLLVDYCWYFCLFLFRKYIVYEYVKIYNLQFCQRRRPLDYTEPHASSIIISQLKEWSHMLESDWSLSRRIKFKIILHLEYFHVALN